MRARRDRCPDATPFHTPEWILPWWRHLGSKGILALTLPCDNKLHLARWQRENETGVLGDERIQAFQRETVCNFLKALQLHLLPVADQGGDRLGCTISQTQATLTPAWTDSTPMQQAGPALLTCHAIQEAIQQGQRA